MSLHYFMMRSGIESILGTKEVFSCVVKLKFEEPYVVHEDLSLLSACPMLP